MAIGTAYSSLRRVLAQRLNYWGGDISSNGPGAFTGTGTVNTAIDTTRPEPDDEWDSSWVVLNPGSLNQTQAPTVWRRVADNAGWVNSTGVLTITGSWPSPYNVTGPGYDTGTSSAVDGISMTVAGTPWTVNQWRGHTVTLGGSFSQILSNTNNKLTLTTAPAGWTGGTPGNGTYAITMPYELYKVFRPENWQQALNWAITNSYPKRHIDVNFEVPQDSFSRIINWGSIVKNLALSNPLVAPVVTELADGSGNYKPGVYTFAVSYENNIGETLVSPTTTVTFTGTNSRAQFAALTGLPAAAFNVDYYGSIEPGDAQLGQFSIGSGQIPNTSPAGAQPGLNLNGTATQITFPNPYVGTGKFPSIYNTTQVDVQELHHILQRINPGSYPEIWNDLGSDLWKPIGGKSIMLMYTPYQAFNIKFICSGVVPSIAVETDVTDEPPELLYAGAEHYLWTLLQKTSTIVNVNWKELAQDAGTKFDNLKSDYALDVPRSVAFRPVIRTSY